MPGIYLNELDVRIEIDKYDGEYLLTVIGPEYRDYYNYPMNDGIDIPLDVELIDKFIALLENAKEQINERTSN